MVRQGSSSVKKGYRFTCGVLMLVKESTLKLAKMSIEEAWWAETPNGSVRAGHRQSTQSGFYFGARRVQAGRETGKGSWSLDSGKRGECSIVLSSRRDGN